MISSVAQFVKAHFWRVSAGVVLLLGISGCMTRKPAEPTAPAPLPAQTQGKKIVTVLSDPIGLTVVVNGVPVGKTPYELEVEMTDRGYFAKEMTLKVRFLATQPGQISRTVEEVLSPLERVPTSLMFTTEGVGRATPAR